MSSDFTYSYRQIWKVAYPILISLVMEQMIGLTDTAFLGRVGETELAASAIAGVYYLVIYMIGFGFSIGSQIIIARRNGEKAYQETGNVFYHGVFFLLALSVIIIAASEIFSPGIMGKMVASDHVRDAALDYVRFRLAGLVFSFQTAMFRAFYVGTTQTRTLTLNSIVMVISNILFNWVLIFGKAGLPALGIRGAAIGSTLAELVSLIFFIVYTARKTDCRKYGLTSFSGFSFKKLRGILSVSVWTMVQNVISLSTWLVFFVAIEHLGERYLAISNIIRSISEILWMVLMAFATTGSSLVSNLIGNGHSNAIPGLVVRILKLSSAVVALMIIFVLCYPEAVISIYTDLPELISDAVRPLWVLCATYLVTIPANVLFQAVSGTGNTRTAFVMEIVSLAIYLIYCIVVIGIMKADITICWTADFAYGLPLVILCGTYLLSGKWKGKSI